LEAYVYAHPNYMEILDYITEFKYVLSVTNKANLERKYLKFKVRYLLYMYVCRLM